MNIMFIVTQRFYKPYWKSLHKKMKFSIKDFFSKCDQLQFLADVVTLTEEILKRKLHFLFVFRGVARIWNKYLKIS